jgi:hypothetical protein
MVEICDSLLQAIVQDFSVALHVSQAYSRTLITHVLMMLIFVCVLICLLLNIVLNAAIASIALANFFLISLLQSFPQVSRLPRYTSFVTFSILVTPINPEMPNLLSMVFSVIAM